MKIVVLVVIIVLGPSDVCPAPAPALPAAAIPLVVAAASNPLIRTTVQHGARVATSFGGTVARGLGNVASTTFVFTKKHLTAFFDKLKGAKTAASDVTALVPVGGSASRPNSLASATSVASETATVLAGGPKKSVLKKVVSVAGKTAEITAQATNVAVSVAGVVQIGQLTQVSNNPTCTINAPSSSCVLGTGSSNGGFSLGANLQIVWFDKSSTCRENIVNLADKRPSYVQSLPQFSMNANFNFDLHSHRQAVINCGNQAGLPKISLASNYVRQGKPILGTIPLSSNRGVKILAWKGMNWFTEKVENSCTLDSFLTHMILKCKLDSSYTKRNFLIPQNAGEAVLNEIVNQYRKLPFTVSGADQKLANQNWKQLWIKTFEPEFKDHLLTNRKVDYVGLEMTTVIEKLSPSVIYFESSSCKCKENNAQKIKVRRYVFNTLDLPELKRISREGTSDFSQSISYPQFRGSLRTQRRSCTVCVNEYKIDYYFVPGSTWMLYFMFTSLTVHTEVNVFQVPKTFVAHELFAHDKVAIFELGYISCGTTVKVGGLTHHLSFQYFNQQFYYYDDLKGGELIWSPNPNLTIKTKKLVVKAAVYFRP